MSESNIERNRQIDELFRQALDLAEKERNAFLKEATLHDKEMFREVMRLLQYADESQSFFGDTVSDFLAPLEPLLKGDEPSADFTFEEGTLVGSYRIKSLLGKGGMGQVYLAERDDGVFKKAVALKCLKKGMDSEEILRRFRFERHVLARLQHSNIATLLDGGLTDKGHPFFAMEYVEGLPINEYCDQKKLTVRKRLSLFINVCDAVQYAHQQLVVHRDLKPSNILVTENGTVKLLDFGVARILDDEHAFFTTPVTQAGLQLLTPKYAAPEQIKNEQVSTATDIYTLGVLLLELLTGSVPPDVWKNPEQPSAMVLKNAGFDKRETHSDTIHHIAENRSATPEKLNHELKGDLDSILLTALREEPQERFKTVEMLKEDIQNYLNHLPVSARRGTVRYRVRKFAARHKAAAATIIGFLLLTVVFVGTISYQLKVTAGERDRAESALVTSDTVGLFLRSILVAADPREAGQSVTMLDALDRAALRIEEELDGSPDVESRVREAIGMTYRSLGAHDPADMHLTRAHELAWQVFGHTPETFRIKHELALLRMDQGRFEEAHALATNVFEFRKSTYGALHHDSLVSLNVLALINMHTRNLSEALEQARTVVAGRENILGHEHPKTLEAKNTLGKILIIMGQSEEAVEILRAVYDGQTRIQGADHPETLITANDLGLVLIQTGQLNEGIELQLIALEGLAERFPAGSIDVVIPRINIASAQNRADRFHDAKELSQLAIEDGLPVLGEDHYIIAVGRVVLAEAMIELLETDEALIQLALAHKILLDTFGMESNYVQKAESLQRLISEN